MTLNAGKKLAKHMSMTLQKATSVAGARCQAHQNCSTLQAQNPEKHVSMTPLKARV
jgi:hypothetical protein